MRNKCLFALGVVFAMSLTSIVAFAFSFTGGEAGGICERNCRL